MGDHIMDAQAQEDELSLPKATVTKLINEMMPPDVHCAKETRDLLIECCVEFIHLIASEANDMCEKDAKKTIAAEHVVGSLRALGFEAFVREVEGVLKEHKIQAKIAKQDRDKRTSKFEKSGVPEEELARQQQLLFEQARLDFQQAQASSSVATAAQDAEKAHSATQPIKKETDSDRMSETPPASGQTETPLRLSLSANSPKLGTHSSSKTISLSLNHGSSHTPASTHRSSNSSPIKSESQNNNSSPSSNRSGASKLRDTVRPMTISAVRGEVDDGYDDESEEEPSAPANQPRLSSNHANRSSLAHNHHSEENDDYDDPNPQNSAKASRGGKPPERVKSAGSIMSMLNDAADDDYDE